MFIHFSWEASLFRDHFQCQTVSHYQRDAAGCSWFQHVSTPIRSQAQLRSSFLDQLATEIARDSPSIDWTSHKQKGPGSTVQSMTGLVQMGRANVGSTA